MGEVVSATTWHPSDSPWWKSRLLWLLESAPDQAMELWNSPNHEALKKHLDMMAESAEELAISMEDTSDDVIMEMIAAEFCPMTDFPDEELPEELRTEILEWAEKVHEEEAETDEEYEETEDE